MAPMALEPMSWSLPTREQEQRGGERSASFDLDGGSSYYDSLGGFASLSLDDDGAMPAPWSMPSLDAASSSSGMGMFGGGPRSYPAAGGGSPGGFGSFMDPHASYEHPTMSAHHLATGGAGVLISSPGGRYQIKRCQGFVRCDMDIESEVVGWVIGKNGSTIKDMKHKTGCNMWVDQRALKLTITGPDVGTVENAAKGVEAYVAAAPIKAGAVEAAVTRNLDCPPHLLDVLGDRATIARIVKETRAQVVVNKKMMRVIVRGNPHAVDAACDKVAALIAQALVDEQEQRGRAEAKAYQQLLVQHQRWLAARGMNASLGGMGPAGMPIPPLAGIDVLDRDRFQSGEAESEGGDGDSVLSFASLSSAVLRSAGGGAGGGMPGSGGVSGGGGVDFSPASSGPVSPRGQGGGGAMAGGPSWSLFSGSFSGSSVLQDAVSGAVSGGGTPVTSAPGTPIGSPAGTVPAPSPGGSAAPPGLGLDRRGSGTHTGPTSPLTPVAEEAETGSDAGSGRSFGMGGCGGKRPVDPALAALLEELALAKYAGVFRDNEVDLDALSLMEEGDLAELRIPKGPRLKILNAIRRQRRSSEESS